MPGPGPELDVRTAISTIEKALAYTQPLRRRTEGLTWLLFGLASALFTSSYAWVWARGLDPTYHLLFFFLVGYALLSIGPALLTWRIASVVSGEYSVDTKRIAATIAVLAVLLIGVDLALWTTLGEARLNIALSIVTFGVIPWAGLAIAQWSRLSEHGRRDTWTIACVMAVAGFALVYGFRADAATVDLDMGIFAITNAVIPSVVGLWRLARA